MGPNSLSFGLSVEDVKEHSQAQRGERVNERRKQLHQRYQSLCEVDDVKHEVVNQQSCRQQCDNASKQRRVLEGHGRSMNVASVGRKPLPSLVP